MSLNSLTNLPNELIYSIFQYLDKASIVYAFFELNERFLLLSEDFIGQRFNLRKVDNETIFKYSLTNVLPLVGSKLRYLSIGSPFYLTSYIECIKYYCPQLNTLTIYCCSKEDIRRYLTHLLHSQLKSLQFFYNNNIVAEEISIDLLKKSKEIEFRRKPIAHSIVFYLTSDNDLILLKRYSQSNYISDGFYMIESMLSNEWLTDDTDDLYLTSKKISNESIFSIKQVESEHGCLEYNLYNIKSQCRLSVLICDGIDENWVPSSILSAQRKESSRSCSTFTFEKLDDENCFGIRPCYHNSKRLQALGKRIIVSFSRNENTVNHHFKLHRVS